MYVYKLHAFIWDRQTPQPPYILYILDIGTTGNKNVYLCTLESGNNIIKQIQDKWTKHFSKDISFDTVTSGFEIIKKKHLQSINNFITSS